MNALTILETYSKVLLNNTDLEYEELQKAIKELEALEAKSKSCENCKYFSDEITMMPTDGDGLCYHERTLECLVFKDMCCSKHEPK